MSHVLAVRCTACGVVDDPPCPECPGVNGSAHGIANQNPFHIVGDGYIHAWHRDCIGGDQ